MTAADLTSLLEGRGRGVVADMPVRGTSKMHFVADVVNLKSYVL
jgi:hypothetical protein